MDGSSLYQHAKKEMSQDIFSIRIEKLKYMSEKKLFPLKKKTVVCVLESLADCTQPKNTLCLYNYY